jgi:hypothetical protein
LFRDVLDELVKTGGATGDALARAHTVFGRCL